MKAFLLSNSMKILLDSMEFDKKYSQKDLMTLIPHWKKRTIRYYLNLLVKEGLISYIPNLRDLRSNLYYKVRE